MKLIPRSLFIGFAVAAVLACEKRDTADRTPPPSTPSPPAQAPDLWQVVHRNRTIREWYARAVDKDLMKLHREEAFQQLATAGRPGLFALYELLKVSDADSVKPMDPAKWDASAVQPGFVRWKAAEALGNCGPAGEPSAPLLAELMTKDPAPNVRVIASVALAKIKSRDPGVLQALKQTLRSRDFGTWQGAVIALASAPPMDAESIKLLEEIGNADPYKLGKGDSEWAAVMNGRMAAREALMKR